MKRTFHGWIVKEAVHSCKALDGLALVPTETTFNVTHLGKRMTVRSHVDILLTPEYAAERGFDVTELRRKGLIVDR